MLDASPSFERQLAFGLMVSRISAGLVGTKAEEIDQTITDTLRTIGESMGLKRCALVSLNIDATSVTHDWHAPDLSNLTSAKRSVCPEHARHLTEYLVQRDGVSIRTVDGLPDCDCVGCLWGLQQEHETSIAIPIPVENGPLGALALFGRDEQDWVEIASARPIWHLIAAMVGDVLARTQAERRLRDSEEMLQLLIEQAPVSIEIYEPSGLRLLANSGWERLWGVADPDVAAAPFNILEDTQIKRRGYDRVFAAAARGETVTLKAIKFDPSESNLPGQARWTDCYVFPVRATSGEIRNIIVLQDDVTEQIETASRLEVFKHFTDASGQGCAWSDLKGRIAYANEALAKILKLDSKADLVECTFLEFYDEPTRVRLRQEIQPLVLAGKQWTGELPARRVDGVVVPTLNNFFLIRDERGEPLYFAALITDLSERIRAEEDRSKLESKIQRAQKLESLGVLAGGIAHDFNNLLCGILGGADLALAELGAQHPAREALDILVQSAQRATELCQQMLAYSGGGRLVVEPIDLNETVENFLQLLQASVITKAALHCQLAANLPVIEADVTQIRQVLLNLVINASEALGDRPGSISISTKTVTVHSDSLLEGYAGDPPKAGEYVMLNVTDDGVGIIAENHARIFDPFFSTKFTGRGLGLAVTLGIVRSHGGAIHVESEVNVGTTFSVLLPSSMRQRRMMQSATVQTSWNGGGRVLLIDDELAVRNIARRMLEALKFDVVVAADGHSGVEIFQQHPGEFALAVIDLTMPGLDGEGVFRELRRIQPDIKVILMSGYNEQDTTKRFVGLGLTGFLSKPFRIEDMRTKIREALDASPL
jgi:PAS domain S-box-containing protein